MRSSLLSFPNKIVQKLLTFFGIKGIVLWGTGVVKYIRKFNILLAIDATNFDKEAKHLALYKTKILRRDWFLVNVEKSELLVRHFYRQQLS